jgi:hypothetical protein
MAASFPLRSAPGTPGVALGVAVGIALSVTLGVS